jgi:TPR repeat protein
MLNFAVGWGYMTSMSAWRGNLWRVGLLLFLAACHRSSGSSPPGAEKPIDVATQIAGCASVAECEQKCSSGASAACVEAGRLYEFGHVGARDAARAYGLYQKACALGSAGGCYSSAVLLEAGNGVAKNVPRALELYEKVCQMGSKTACTHAETLGESSMLQRR